MVMTHFHFGRYWYVVVVHLSYLPHLRFRYYGGVVVVRLVVALLGEAGFLSIDHRRGEKPHRGVPRRQRQSGQRSRREGLERLIIHKGVFGGPSGPSREGPDVGHKIVSDTKQMTKERGKKKKMNGKREKCVKKKRWKKKREKKGQK